MWPTFCIYRFFILYTKKGVWGVQNIFFMSLAGFFFATLAIKMAEFFKLEAMMDRRTLWAHCLVGVIDFNN